MLTQVVQQGLFTYLIGKSWKSGFTVYAGKTVWFVDIVIVRIVLLAKDLVLLKKYLLTMVFWTAKRNLLSAYWVGGDCGLKWIWL